MTVTVIDLDLNLRIVMARDVRDHAREREVGAGHHITEEVRVRIGDVQVEARTRTERSTRKTRRRIKRRRKRKGVKSPLSGRPKGKCKQDLPRLGCLHNLDNKNYKVGLVSGMMISTCPNMITMKTSK